MVADMADLMSLVKGGENPAGQPNAGVPSPQAAPAGIQAPGNGSAPMGGAGGNPLMALLRGPSQPQMPVSLTHDQVVAAMHYFTALDRALAPLLKDDRIGRENIRPKVFEAAASLMGEKILSLADVMNAIKTLPDDPIGQKKWVEQHLRTNALAQEKIIEDYRASEDEDWMGASQNSKWSQDQLGDTMKSLVERYG